MMASMTSIATRTNGRRVSVAMVFSMVMSVYNRDSEYGSKNCFINMGSTFGVIYSVPSSSRQPPSSSRSTGSFSLSLSLLSFSLLSRVRITETRETTKKSCADFSSKSFLEDTAKEDRPLTDWLAYSKISRHKLLPYERYRVMVDHYAFSLLTDLRKICERRKICGRAHPFLLAGCWSKMDLSGLCALYQTILQNVDLLQIRR